MARYRNSSGDTVEAFEIGDPILVNGEPGNTGDWLIARKGGDLEVWKESPMDRGYVFYDPPVTERRSKWRLSGKL